MHYIGIDYHKKYSCIGVKAEEWAKQRGLERYSGSSIKGEAEIDWDNQEARRAFLQGIVADADRVLGMVGDRAFGDGATRQAFADEGRTLEPGYRAGPTRASSPRRTSRSIWNLALAPVRQE